MTVAVYIQQVPDYVRKCEEDSNDGVRAPFSLQIMLDLAMELYLSFDCSLRLDKQPDDQEDHHKDLAQERVAKYLVHRTVVPIERIFALACMRCDNHCGNISGECKSCDCEEKTSRNA